MSQFPKILVCCPTAAVKNYCFEEWLENTMNLKYPNYQIRLFDNTPDSGYNTIKLNKLFRSKYGENNHKFKSIHVPVDNDESVIERMIYASEEMRQYAIKKNYSHILHLESDVFATENIIEELLFHDKQVIGALYDRDEGIYRKLMIQKIVKEAPDSLLSLNFKSGEEIGFINGSIKKVSSVGLGAVLINMSVLKNLPFRYFGDDAAPDKYLMESFHMMGVKIYAHTGLICPRHENQEWSLKYM